MIIKNGKRIDGCSDTVPIGTINPYIGSIAPYGYLICEGQLVSKTTYKELYEICGDKFGTGTETEFRLPDLRGKTIAGYKEGDTLFGVLGKLIGSENHNHDISHTHGVPGVAHTHTTGNHTLTTAEMPSHSHWGIIGANGVERMAGYGTGTAHTGTINEMTDVAWESLHTGNSGGGGAHNHGDTGSTTPTTTTTNSQSTTTSDNASSIQPTVVMNWIVKAFQLMPNQSYVSSVKQNSDINTYSCNYINKLKTYSTEETIIGTWIDGKPIYRKVFSGTTPSSGDSLNLCDSSNMVLINYGGSIKGSIYGFVIGKSNIGSTNNGLRILNNNGTLTMQYGSQYLGYSYELFVEYTKTTD